MAEPTVKVSQKSVIVTVKSTGQRIVVASPKVKIVTVGKLGPPGPSGENADATFEWVNQQFDIAVDPQQVFELAFEPRAGSMTVFLNGLLERFWSLAGDTLTLEDAALPGDNITVNYQKEI